MKVADHRDSRSGKNIRRSPVTIDGHCRQRGEGHEYGVINHGDCVFVHICTSSNNQ